MKGLYRAALVLGLAVFGATSLEAATVNESDVAITDAVLIMNNYSATVEVYAEDLEGRLHSLGRVARNELKGFEIPEDVARADFRIKISPRQGGSALQWDNYSVKTGPLGSDLDGQVVVWVEPDLARSTVQLIQR